MNNEGVRRSWQPSDQPDRRLPGLTNQDSASDDQIRVHAPPLSRRLPKYIKKRMIFKEASLNVEKDAISKGDR